MGLFSSYVNELRVVLNGFAIICTDKSFTARFDVQVSLKLKFVFRANVVSTVENETLLDTLVTLSLIVGSGKRFPVNDDNQFD